MSDAAGSNSNRCNKPDSSSPDADHRQPESPILPEYSQCPIDGIDTLAQQPPGTLLGCHQQPVPSAAPPRYEHPPPYAAGWTPGQNSLNEVRIHGLPDSSVAAARRGYLRARPAPSNSTSKYFILATFALLCGCVFGAVAFILAVVARRKSASQARRFNHASMCVSVIGIIIGIILLLFLLIIFVPMRSYCGTVEEFGWNQTMDESKPKTTTSPEVTSLVCYVDGNETTCFQFASNFTAKWCSKIGGVIVNVNSSSSSSSSASAAATSSTICYHNVCTDYVVDTSCFQYRTTSLDRDECHGINGYYIIEPSGRSCYYNDCPGFTASNNKCYRYRQPIGTVTCIYGFYDGHSGYCYYNNKP